VRMWGGAVPLAYALQLVTTLALGAGLAWLWRSQAAFAVQAAALAIAAILATPYSLDYDMMAFAPAIAFLAADGLGRGFAPYEKTMLAALWLLPLIARAVTQITFIPVGPIVMGAAFALLLGQARRNAAPLRHSCRSSCCIGQTGPREHPKARAPSSCKWKKKDFSAGSSEAA